MTAVQMTAVTQPLTVRSVRVHRRRAPLLRPFVTAKRRTDAVEYVVVDVEVEAADGTRAAGQGSAAETRAVTGEDTDTMTAALQGPLAAALEGADGTVTDLDRRIAAAVDGATSAKSALSVALHDAWARTLDLPLVQALAALRGWPVDPDWSIEADMTVSLEDPRTMAGHAEDAAADGYRILKVKLGSSEQEDRQRLEAVVRRVPGARLRLDANQGWQPQEAIRILKGLEDSGLPVDLVEQPCPAADITGMAEVREAVGIPIMADESLWDADDARALIDAGAADLFNIKLAKTGTITGALAIADAALEAGIGCMVGAMMEPRISITAAAHVAAAHPAVTMIDLDSPDWFAERDPVGGYEVADGTLRLLGGAGLGLERLDEKETNQ
ncbi:dipeptide epimerase [Helcobacillus massiliensis]|uniref:dipeptide epimerase n=1 Tax=Helcobacillus massiliensis TaxID=521392 RepID=UPI0021A2C538|nr:dipeptide epimerase [Helcobacillus massiliensis]MCT1556858.1 dipeptide epimerase [Helcobacillus massiliensis]MCT2035682.1 dipeptide epimerase [Helcobacillus massiliensis]MCT2330866.1 dipeptide epimerase [Helcobacillus massiliensis]